jgi:hypothetical protein
MQVFQTMRRAGLASLALPAVLALIGCGGPGSSGSEARSREHYSIGQIGQIFRIYQKGQKPPPKTLKDLLPLQNGFPSAIESLKSREVLVYWGAGISDSSDAASTVLAYQKDVPEKGGEVLMQDGTDRLMTAEEFKAASKPPGASTDDGMTSKKKKR